MVERAPDVGYYRDGYQVALLQLATLGLYFPYWLIRSRAAANGRLGLPPTPWAFWLLLLVPVLFFYPIFSTFGLLEKSVDPRVRPRVNIVVAGLVLVILMACWALPPTYDLLAFVSILPLGVMQENLFQTDLMRATPTNKQARFHWFELVLNAVGVPIVSLVLLASVFADASPNYNALPALFVVFFDAVVLYALYR